MSTAINYAQIYDQNSGEGHPILGALLQNYEARKSEVESSRTRLLAGVSFSGALS